MSKQEISEYKQQYFYIPPHAPGPPPISIYFENNQQQNLINNHISEQPSSQKNVREMMRKPDIEIGGESTTGFTAQNNQENMKDSAIYEIPEGEQQQSNLPPHPSIPEENKDNHQQQEEQNNIVDLKGNGKNQSFFQNLKSVFLNQIWNWMRRNSLALVLFIWITALTIDYEEKIKYLQTQINSLNEEVKDQKALFTKYNSDSLSGISDLNKNYAQLIKNNSDNISEITDLNNKYAQLIKNNSDSLSGISDLNNKHTQLIKSNSDQISDLNNKYNNLPQTKFYGTFREPNWGWIFTPQLNQMQVYPKSVEIILDKDTLVTCTASFQGYQEKYNTFFTFLKNGEPVGERSGNPNMYYNSSWKGNSSLWEQVNLIQNIVLGPGKYIFEFGVMPYQKPPTSLTGNQIYIMALSFNIITQELKQG